MQWLGSLDKVIFTVAVRVNELSCIVSDACITEQTFKPHSMPGIGNNDKLSLEMATLQTSYSLTVALSNSILMTYNYTTFSVLPVYAKLIKGGLKIWIYSGDAEGRVPIIGSRYYAEALGLPVKSRWSSWYYDHQARRIVEYEGLKLVTVRGAGHHMPLNKPTEALAMVHSYLTGQPLPKQR
ncbi:hypothetical protein MLD38_023613 [Melastoma candidum]|uniref:Uncharacterized protein n=1 Tax=Melastoma candidum TaxID=119954 RepID=A0ACB9NWC2_9MYRT|nr:hypothetical protein MLD38_023613 [Melastoma candidum]